METWKCPTSSPFFNRLRTSVRYLRGGFVQESALGTGCPRDRRPARMPVPRGDSASARPASHTPRGCTQVRGTTTAAVRAVPLALRPLYTPRPGLKSPQRLPTPHRDRSSRFILALGVLRSRVDLYAIVGQRARNGRGQSGLAHHGGQLLLLLPKFEHNQALVCARQMVVSSILPAQESHFTCKTLAAVVALRKADFSWFLRGHFSNGTCRPRRSGPSLHRASLLVQRSPRCCIAATVLLSADQHSTSEKQYASASSVRNNRSIKKNPEADSALA